jgi:hypothetical protein
MSHEDALLFVKAIDHLCLALVAGALIRGVMNK